MTFIAFGLNHKTTPIEIREKISPTPEKQHELLLDLVQESHVHGAMMLATCNRTEIYCDTDQASNLLPWLAERQALPQSLLNNYTYLYQADKGIRHAMRVACGLDSMVLGEPQILGQMKQAYHSAHEIGTLNSPLQHVFRHVFNASKKVRSQTAIGAYPVSVAFTAVHLIRKVFKDLSHAHVLLIGSGDTATLVAKHLKNQGVNHFYVASRTLQNAQKTAASLSQALPNSNIIQSLTIPQIPNFMTKADIIISATQCPLPFIGKEMVAGAVKSRQNKPLFIFDLAVPRDVEANVNELASVFLYNIDDLQSIANEGLEERQQASLSAENIIEEELDHYLLKERGKKARHAICQYRKYAKNIRAHELLKAKQQLEKGLSPIEIIEKMSHRLTQKLLHRPSLNLRQAAFEERLDLLEHTVYLYEDA